MCYNDEIQRKNPPASNVDGGGNFPVLVINQSLFLASLAAWRLKMSIFAVENKIFTGMR
jgi:hypothetical protein